MEYAIATFCYGDRYHKQTNRMIESFDYMEKKPPIYIVTDDPEAIYKRDFVFVKHINKFNSKYFTYGKDYYTFDFSVKRFSVQYAFDEGYEKIILTDTDVLVNDLLYTHETIMECFIPNSIMGQVTYNFTEQQKTNTDLGARFLHYEKIFNVEYDKNELNFMPEDCVQFIDIKGENRYNFLNTWNECIKIKDNDNLRNTPAGNIDEMCFSALFNGLKVGNNSNKHYNLIIPRHDKWY
jgi:hypothetical protein